MPTSLHERYAHDILSRIDSGRPVSQRSLAHDLGIALGLTNLLVRRLVQKGWIRVIQIRPNRVRYLLTPAGLAEKARMSRRVVREAVRTYISARDRIRESLATLASRPEPARTVFYGIGDLADIAYVCLRETGLRLVAVVDDSAHEPFFGFPIHSASELGDGVIGAIAFDILVVTSFDEDETVLARIAERVSAERIHWL